MSRLPYIYVHADDYGMTPATCQRIQDCWEHGCLNSISVMPNGCLECSAELKIPAELPCAIHLNLVEGKGMMPAEQIDLLVRPDGYMKNSFFELLMLSLSPKRKRLEEQLYLEMKAQVCSTMHLLSADGPILLDSHQHTHMIPLIFKTILRIVKEEHLPVQYLRISAEPVTPFLLEPSLYPTYRPVNLIKNGVLNFLWLFDRKAFRASGISSALFCGIVFSGNMDAKRVLKVFPHFYRRAEKYGCDLEFLFHPGYTEPGEEFMDPYKEGFHLFYLSKGRKAENEALHSQTWCELIKEKNREAVPLGISNKNGKRQRGRL